MTKHADKNPVGVVRIDNDGANLLSIAQAEMFPSVAAIGGGAGDDAAKRTIKRIRNGDDEANKTSTASGGQQGQQKTEP